jgi:hypothetical protein
MKGKLGQLLAGVCVLCLSALISLPLRAQVAGATLTGTVTDTQGGAIPNAKVSARNTATGVSTDTTTNAAGLFNIVNLVPGDYDVNVSAPGFSTVVTKVTLTVGATQALNPSLQVGQVTQEVQVTGVAPIVETTNATLSGEVVGQQIIELPLNGRDWAQLATLQPGVAQVRPHEAVDAPGGETRGLGMQMTVDGNRPQQNAYRLNGIIVNDYSNAGPGNVLGANMGVDAIQEFSVLTSNYSAEYGFTSGGVINAITKSGTNTFHGSAYEFVRNSAFDAANFFENANNEKKGSFTRNQFGASAGWKVLKDRAFLFGDYEGLRQSKAIPQIAQTLTSNARLGIINDAAGLAPGAPGSANTIWVGSCPHSNMTNLAPGQSTVCVDNTIEKLVNPSGTPAGGLEPLPNGALLGPDNNVAQFVSDGNQKVTDNYSTVRGDLKITDKDSLVGTWYRDHSTWTKPDAFNQDINGFQVPHAAYTLEENHIFSSAMVNTLRLGLNQSNLVSPAISTSNPLELDTTLGILPGCTAPGVSIGSGGLSVNSATADTFGGFTGAQGFYAKTAIIQVFDDVSRTAGKHNVKFGFMYLGDHQDWGQGAGCGGSASFASIQNFLQNIPAKVRMPAVPPFTSGPTTHHYRQKIFGGYVQDDWKFRSNLTFNLGLRYEMATIPTETQDKINQLETLWQNPTASGTCVADLNGLASCPGFYHQTFQHNPTLKNFEPRIGFAWDPFKTGKTSVRGGFGLFDNLPLSYMFALNSLQVAPNGAEVDLSNPGQGTYPVGFAPIALGTSATASSRYGFNEQFPKRNYIMQWNLNVQRQVSPSTSVTLAYAGSRGIHNPFQTDELNTVFPFRSSAGWLFPVVPSTADPTHVIPTGTPVACSASVTDPVTGKPVSLVPPGSCGTAVANPTGIVPGQLINPNVALIQSTIFQAQSWYEALQARVDKRLSHNLQVGGSFTWGKSLDTSSSSFAGDNYSNNITPTIEWWDIHLSKGPSDFNVTRNVVINGLWTVPTPASFTGPLSFVAKGWELGAVFEASDGTPLWTLGGIEGDPMGQLNGEPMSIPDYVSGCKLTNTSSGRSGALQYINPNCYINAVAPSGFDLSQCDQGFILRYAANNPGASLPANTCINLLGNLGRNTVIGPGLLNLDFSVVKDNYIKRITESFNVQFRAEFFNVLNRANFAPPKAGNLEALSATGTTPPGFGILTTTQVPNREIQFALKLIW